MSSTKAAPIIITRDTSTDHTIASNDAPFSPPAEGNFDFSGLINLKRKQQPSQQLDTNSNVETLTNDHQQPFFNNNNNNNPKNNQYLRVSLLKKKNIFDSESSLSSTTSASSSSQEPTSESSTPSTSPFLIRKNNSELLNKMIEIAFKHPHPHHHQQQQQVDSNNNNSNIDAKQQQQLYQKCNQLRAEYRELNTLVPDSL